MSIRKAAMPIVAALVAMVALAAGGAGAATTSVTITVPTAGQSISLKKTPYLAVAGKASFAPATAGAPQLYLRRDGRGTGNHNPPPNRTNGTHAGAGRGFLFN